MKFQSVLRLTLLPSLSCACFGANLAFPVNGISNGTQLDGTWTQSDGAVASDKLAFFSTVGPAYQGVSVGAYFDDYSAIDSYTGSRPSFAPGFYTDTVNGDGGFTVGHATAAVAVGGATIDWHFVITPPSGGSINGQAVLTTLNDYTISVLNTSAVNVLTILLTNLDPTHWNAFANNNYMGVIESNGFYALHAQFGTTTGYSASITGAGVISYTDVVSVNSGTFGSVQVGTDQGTGKNNFGDGFITVVPEPSAALLGAIGVLGLLRRRR